MAMQKRLNAPSAEEGVPNTVRVSGRFTTAGAGAPTVFSSGPFTVTRTGVGGLRVTLKENAVEVLYAAAHLADATASTKRAFVVSTSVGSVSAAASFDIETQSSAGTAADLTGPIVHFDVAYRKGQLTR